MPLLADQLCKHRPVCFVLLNGFFRLLSFFSSAISQTYLRANHKVNDSIAWIGLLTEYEFYCLQSM